MSYVFRGGAEAKAALDMKPPHGAPCNSCGLCCMAALCDLGQHVLKRPELPGPCPALTKTDSGYVCGLALDPEKYASAARVLAFGVGRLRAAALLLIGSGNGCDARFNGEPRDAAFADALDRRCHARAKSSSHAFRIWGARPK